MNTILAARFARAAVAAALVMAALTGCSSDDDSSAPGAGERPATSARIQILSPTPFEETGRDVTVRVKLIGAREVPQVSGPVRPDEGHIHVSLDGAVVAMAYEDSQVLENLTPGEHSVQVDFVAVDHLPFRNRVTAAVVFRVR